jgi:hypothetical protein
MDKLMVYLVIFMMIIIALSSTLLIVSVATGDCVGR